VLSPSFSSSCRRLRTLLALASLAGAAAAQDAAAETAPAEVTPAWPSWRGPLGTGVAPDATPPLRWSETENVRWRTILPGTGHSTPVLTDGLLVLTATHPIGPTIAPRPDDAPGAHDNLRVDQRHRYLALAVEADDGTIAWQTSLTERFPHEGGHVSGTYASASPVTDGERVYVSLGSAGLYALDLGGQILWGRELEPLRSKHGHGEGSGPALHGGTLFFNADHEGQSYLLALDALTGETRWRVERDEVTSWATPLVVDVEGEAQLVVSGTAFVRGYDPESGVELWRCTGLSHNVVATPVYADGLLFAASSYEKQALLALRLPGARGDLEGTEHVAWYRRRNAPYVPSPLLYGDALYVLNHYQGVVSRYEAASGERPASPLRLPGIVDVYASPLGAAGRVYVVDRSGTTVVLSHEPPLRELARNHLDDRFSASPVAVGPDLFLRGERFLYCLREAEDE